MRYKKLRAVAVLSPAIFVIYQRHTHLAFIFGLCSSTTRQQHRARGRVSFICRSLLFVLVSSRARILEDYCL